MRVQEGEKKIEGEKRIQKTNLQGREIESQFFIIWADAGRRTNPSPGGGLELRKSIRNSKGKENRVKKTGEGSKDRLSGADSAPETH